MSQDLEQYQDIIEQLKPMINEPEFNQVLSQIASHIPKQKRFLLKMELKRLARPCTRLIDLRGHIDGQCDVYNHEGRDHYMDDVATEVFEKQVRQFGSYTIGVYEAVSNTENNYRVIQQKQQQSIEQATRDKDDIYKIDLINFGRYSRRGEERMNFAVNIEIFTEQNRGIQASTINISVNGLKAKLNKEQLFKVGDKITIQFRGLEGEYTLDKKNGIGYKITQVDRDKHEQHLCMQRTHDIPTPAFDAFIERFIHGNKRRYKVNMDNTFDAIRNKTFEQYYIPNFTSMPIFIEKHEKQYRAKYMLSNDCNRESIYYWTDEEHQLKLGYLLPDKRIATVLAKQEGQQETFIYAFNHIKDDKLYFYSASQDELLSNHSLLALFLSYGSRKASWRVYKLQITALDLQDAHLPLSIPDSVNATVKRQNQPPTPRLMGRLKRVSHMALITDITEEAGANRYQKLKLNRQHLPHLKHFGHPRNRPPADIDIFRFKFVDQRKETRFELRTAVVVRIDDLEFIGVSEDISVRGLRVELKTYYPKERESVVNLSFPSLQSVTQKYTLVDLPYQVRSLSADCNVLHLQAVSDEGKVAERFFDELIRNNRAKLKAYNDEEEIPGMGEALRNIYAKNTLNLAFFIRKEEGKLLPEAAASSSSHSRLLSVFGHQADRDEINLKLLYQSQGVEKEFMVRALRQLKRTNTPVMRELFIAFDPSQVEYADAVKSRLLEDFNDDKQRRDFIASALNNGQFIAVKIFISRTGRPDTDTLQTEINYVGSYAIHRSKMLQEQLWGIIGVGDMLDVTDEVMLRYLFTPQQIQDNHQAPKRHEVKSDNIEEILKS